LLVPKYFMPNQTKSERIGNAISTAWLGFFLLISWLCFGFMAFGLLFQWLFFLVLADHYPYTLNIFLIAWTVFGLVLFLRYKD